MVPSPSISTPPLNSPWQPPAFDVTRAARDAGAENEYVPPNSPRGTAFSTLESRTTYDQPVPALLVDTTSTSAPAGVSGVIPAARMVPTGTFSSSTMVPVEPGVASGES